MTDFVGGLAGGAAGGAANRALLRRRARRYQSKGRLECNFRVIRGEHAGLAQRWWAGIATLSPGGIDFIPYVGGVRFLRRKAVRIQVHHVDQSRQRPPRGREILSISPDAQVIEVATPTATLEWAILPNQLAWAVDRIARA